MSNNLHYLPRIGMAEAQSLYGMTARALRFYEARGLLTAHRDRLNCRYFDGHARRRLSWIAALRKAGLSLPDIREVLDAEEYGHGGVTAIHKLQARRLRLAAELAQVDDLTRSLGSDLEPATSVA